MILSYTTLSACATVSCHRGMRSRDGIGCWVSLSLWRVRNHTGPGRPPDSRPHIPDESRLPRPAQLFLGAEHSSTSSLAPMSHSVSGRIQRELQEMSLRTDFPESSKQIAAGNQQHKNTSNGEGSRQQFLLGVHNGHSMWAAIKNAGGKMSVKNN